VLYALVGVGVLFLASAFISSPLGLDVWQLSGIWLALIAGVCFLTVLTGVACLPLLAALMMRFLPRTPRE
jgi:hypothetical protein